MPGAYPPYEAAAVPGIPSDVAGNTIVLPPNNLDLLEKTLASDRDIAVVILEPTGGHAGAVPIRGAFLKALRDLTTKHGQLLIFDEVITGFRVSPGRAQQFYGIKPDLTTLAKIIAGGLPGGCLAGRADVMDQISQRPGKPKMKHPGTFNANPLSAAAGITTLKQVATGEPCRRANAMGRLLRNRLNAMFTEQGWPWIAYVDFSMFGYCRTTTALGPSQRRQITTALSLTTATSTNSTDRATSSSRRRSDAACCLTASICRA
jgi:glutamate-1-semialdehyde 2,1-aminomutase